MVMVSAYVLKVEKMLVSKSSRGCERVITISHIKWNFNYTNFIFRLLNFSGVGVYISRIEEGSMAERAGLRPGDTILEVNGTPFTSINHDEALKVLHNLIALVEDRSNNS